VTVYYPFALIELLDHQQADDGEDGEILLSFRDEDGAEVKIRMRRELAEEIRNRLAAPPDSSR
jgi:hypothetical protein